MFLFQLSPRRQLPAFDADSFDFHRGEMSLVLVSFKMGNGNFKKECRFIARLHNWLLNSGENNSPSFERKKMLLYKYK